jgi:actin-like ATPase involved in cell morphogenesis
LAQLSRTLFRAIEDSHLFGHTQLTAIDWLIMLLYFAFVLGIGFALKRYMKTSKDFFQAGRALPAWICGLAFMSANLGAQEVIGMGASGAKYGIATSHYYWIGAPEIWIALGAGASAIDRRGLSVLAQHAGAARTRFCSLSACKALGLDLPLFQPTGSLLVDVGASCTRVDLLSLGQSVAHRMVDAAGDQIAEWIARLMRDRYNLMVGGATSQSIKHQLLGEGLGETTANGRDLVTGLPQAVTLERDEVLPAVEQLAEQIAHAVRELLRDVSPELVADLAERGVFLTGGGARLGVLGDILQDRLDLPLWRDSDPEQTICSGLQLALDPNNGGRLRLRSA